MEQKFLPIGTVVQLKDSTALAMIAGYFPVTQSEPGKVYDYSGFKFPVGFVRNNEVYCFNRDQIELVVAYGYRDIEEDQFMQRLEASEEEVRRIAGDGKEGK